MAELITAMNALLKKKYPEDNLPLYMHGLSALYARISTLRFSMNYFMFAEVLEDSPAGITDEFAGENEKLQGIVSSLFSGENDSDPEKEILSLRSELIEKMDSLTALIDHLTIYEYIINRMEFRYKDGGFDDNYYRNGFEKDIYRYVTSDRDNQVINAKISRVITELPMRLSRNKFEDLIRNSYSLYLDSDKLAIDDFTYKLRSCSGLHEPKGMREYFPELAQKLDELDGFSCETAGKNEYEVMAAILCEASDLATEYSDRIVMLMEMVNDLLSVYMTRNSLKEVKEYETLSHVIVETHRMIEKERDLDETLSEEFIAFEGVQEKVMSQIFSPESALPEINEICGKEIDSLGLREEMDDLLKLQRLQSSSTFAELSEDPSSGENPGEIYLHRAVDDLIEEFSMAFDKVGRSKKRAMMAAVIGNIPVYFNNLQEFSEYVHVSLGQCSDEAERQACMNIISAFMENDT